MNPGDKLGQFTITRKIADGAIGVVYEAVDHSLDRPVALKFLDKIESDQDHHEFILREARNASQLKGPNVCIVHSVENFDGNEFICMEFVDGLTLAETIEKGMIPIETVIDYGIQICRALEEAGAKKLIHRDLKPANIMIDKKGTVKVMDFGLSKIVESDQSPSYPSGLKGTLAYSSPEQLTQRRMDARSDLYSLGVILYHMIAGRLPFEAFVREALVYEIEHTDPPSLVSLRPDAPASLIEAVKKCLKKDPNDRYANATDLLNALSNLKSSTAKIQNRPNQLSEFSQFWVGRCFLCGDHFEPHYAGRLYHACRPKMFAEVDFFRHSTAPEDSFVTILPELKGQSVKDLISHQLSDPFMLGDPTSKPLEKIDGFLSLKIPFGRPVCLDNKSLADFAGVSRVSVLDLSQYFWSGTLKDLRSWAILSIAQATGIRRLVLWTAGNAGYSLAKIVHRLNALNGEKEKMTVHCLVSANTAADIVAELRAQNATVSPISTNTGEVITRTQIERIMGATDKERGQYWHVTDGWDGVGVYVYRLLAAQAIQKSRPDYIIVPVGTGDILLGFYLANRDLNFPSKVVGALPFDSNVVRPFVRKTGRFTSGIQSMRRGKPVAPKLSGFYSPLSPCLYELTLNRNIESNNSVEFIEVDNAAQIEAGAQIIGKQPFLCEPSALIAFGASRSLVDVLQSKGIDVSSKNVMIVNSGSGLMGKNERELYSKSLIHF